MGLNRFFPLTCVVVSILIHEALCQTCDPTWFLYNDLCFKYFEEHVIHSETKERCGSQGGRVISALTPRLKDFLIQHSGQRENSTYWCNTLTGKFGDSDFPLTTPLPPSITTSVAAGRVPAKPNQERKCYYIDSKGIKEGSCSDGRGFICEKDSIPPPGTCPQGAQKIGSSCFSNISELLDRQKAEESCSTKGSWLAKLNSRQKVIYGSATVFLTRKSFWVGARRVEGKLKWDGGEILDLEEDKAFIPTQDDGGDCLRLGLSDDSESGTQWIIGDCNVTAYALCEEAVVVRSTVMTSTTRMTSTTPMTSTTTMMSTLPPKPECPGKNEKDGICYWVATQETESVVWEGAREHCQSYGGDLASYRNAEEEGFTLGNAKGNDLGIWIGLKREPGSNAFRWSDGKSLSYTNWAPGQPKTGNDMKLCVAHTGVNSTWEVLYCGVRRLFACKIPKANIPVPHVPPTKPPITECSKPKKSPMITWRRHQDYCYGFEVSRKFSWETAKGFCQDNGAFLESIHSIDELNFLLSANPGSSGQNNFWIGLRAKGLHSSYNWDDGTPVNFVNFDDEDIYDDSSNVDTCVSLDTRTGFWVKHHCNNLGYAICKTRNDIDYVFTTTAPTPGLPGFCPDGWYSFGNKCYQISGFDVRETWEGANKKCAEIGSALVTIHSQKEQDFLALLVLNLQYSTWIGLYSTIGGRLFHWVDNSSLDFTYWNLHEPNYNDKKEECVHLSFSNDLHLGRWNDHQCTMTFPYICQIPKDPMMEKPGQDPFHCTEPEGWLKLQSSCYKLFNDSDNRLTWLQAQSFCLSVSANLASVRNFGITTLLQNHLQGLEGPFWIGMKATKKHKYTWLGTSTLSYTNWQTGQPQEVSELHNCVAVNAQGKWMVRDCDESHPFICEEGGGIPTVGPYDPDTVCPNASKLWQEFGGNVCYIIEPRSLFRWYEASHICYIQGGYLASFHSSDELNTILHHIRDFTLPVHIGMAQRGDGSFGWFDGSPVDYVNWAAGEPNSPEELCVEMHTDLGTWNDIKCFERRGYVCSTMKVPREKKETASVSAITEKQEDLRTRIAAGGIVGIVVCVLVLVAIGAVSCYYFCPSTSRRRRASVLSSP